MDSLPLTLQVITVFHDMSSNLHQSNPEAHISIGNFSNVEKRGKEIQNNKLNYSRLFGAHIEVNFLLLEIERRKLIVLKQDDMLSNEINNCCGLSAIIL